MTSHTDYLAERSDVFPQKVSEYGNGGVMFNVPNPESDIDPSKTKEDGDKAFKTYIAAQRAQMTIETF